MNFSLNTKRTYVLKKNTKTKFMKPPQVIKHELLKVNTSINVLFLNYITTFRVYKDINQTDPNLA